MTRLPPPKNDPPGRLAGLLRRRELAVKAAAIVLVLVGMPALLVGPLVLGTIYWVIGLTWHFYLPWTWVFVGSVVLLVPLLFWTESRTRGSLLSDAVTAESERDTPMPFVEDEGAAGMLINFALHPRLSSAGLVEIFLWGPRQILDAAGKFRRVRWLRNLDRARVEEMLRTLRRTNRGMAIDALLLPAEESGKLMTALAYLLVYDWIAVSSDGQRVWLLPDAVRRLEK